MEVLGTIGISHIPHCYGELVVTPLSYVILSSHLVRRLLEAIDINRVPRYYSSSVAMATRVKT